MFNKSRPFTFVTFFRSDESWPTVYREPKMLTVGPKVFKWERGRGFRLGRRGRDLGGRVPVPGTGIPTPYKNFPKSTR